MTVMVNAKLIERLRKERGAPLKELVNEALRTGLNLMTKPVPRPRKPFRTPTADLGECFLPSLDNIGEVLEILEGPMHK